jgi:hypothetical protein
MLGHARRLLLVLAAATAATAPPPSGVDSNGVSVPLILSSGHANLTSVKQLRRFEQKYSLAPLVVGVSAQSCAARCAAYEPAYGALARRLREHRIPFLRVDADASPGLAAHFGRAAERSLPEHGLYWGGQFHRCARRSMGGRRSAAAAPALTLSTASMIHCFERTA